MASINQSSDNLAYSKQRHTCNHDIKPSLYLKGKAMKFLKYETLELSFIIYKLLCLTFCNPMDCSTLDLPVPHHLPKFAQIHVYCINDALQPSHPLIPSPSLFFFFSFIFISWRLITLQYCSGFCHTLT